MGVLGALRERGYKARKLRQGRAASRIGVGSVGMREGHMST